MSISINNKGITLIMATAVIMALSILAVSVLSITGSQSSLGQGQVDKIKAENLAKGFFWRYYNGRATTGLEGGAIGSENLDGKLFNVSIVRTAGAGPNGTDRIVTRINF